MRLKYAALCAMVMVSSLAIGAPATPTVRSTELAQHLMAKRNAVQSELLGNTATPDQLREAIARFKAILVELDNPAVQDLARGHTWLHAERLNNLFPMAETYVRLGMHDEALKALEQSQAVLWLPGDALTGDPAFAPLKSDPRFATIAARAKIAKNLFELPADVVAYKEKLSVEERVAGLSLFWYEARQNFAFFDNVPELDWNKTYMEYLGKVMAAKTTREYYDVLMRLAPLLRDGHTNIYPPEALTSEFYSRPPVRAALIEDRVIVTQVSSPSLDKVITPGDEIVAIDGIPVKQYAAQRVTPYASSSTEQDRIVRTFTYQLLLGAANVPVKLTLAGASGTRRDVTLQRSGYKDLRRKPQFEFKMLDGGIAYIALDHFESKDGVTAFENALPQILKAKALVIDVRSNGGGSTDFGYAILRHLTNKPIPGSASYVRSDDVLGRARGDSAITWQRLEDDDEGKPRDAKVFDGPVAVLAGPRTFSAAEDFLVAYDTLGRGIIVGEPTGGSTGQPMFFALPGGGKARICVKRDTYRDGRAFVGKGVIPTVVARPTVQAVRAGQDPVLAKALDTLAAQVK